MSAIGSLLMTAGSGVIGEATKELGYSIGNMTGYNERLRQDQLKQQQALTNMQYNANLGLMKESYNQQKELWDKTQAEAQIEHLKNAGLNPALIYAKGGAGGSTSGGGGASVGGASASDETSRNMAAQANASASSGMALQLQKLASEIDLNKSAAEVNRATASFKGGAETENVNADTQVKNATLSEITAKINNLKADTTLKGEETNLNKLQQNATEIANSYNSENNLTMLKQNIEILKELGAKANVAVETQNSLIKQAAENVKLTLTQEVLNNQSTKLKAQEILASINQQVLDRIQTMSNVTRQEQESILQASMQQIEKDLRNKSIDQSEINTILNILGTLGGALVIKGAFSGTGTKPKIGY